MPAKEACEEEIRVFHWRTRRFLEVGFTLLQSRKLAESGADWHQAQVLLAHGCPAKIVVNLLS